MVESVRAPVKGVNSTLARFVSDLRERGLRFKLTTRQTQRDGRLDTLEMSYVW